jgi:hypothetical protein
VISNKRIFAAYVRSVYWLYRALYFSRRVAYCKTVEHCVKNKWLQNVFHTIDFHDRRTFENHIIRVFSEIFENAGDKPYLPVILDEARLAELTGSRNKSMIFGVHNGFGFIAALLSSHVPVMTVHANVHGSDRMFRRGGVARWENVTKLANDRFALAKFMRSAECNHYVSLVDGTGELSGYKNAIKNAPFQAACRLGLDVWFIRFHFSSAGTVHCDIEGPFAKLPADELVSRFGAFFANLDGGVIEPRKRHGTITA